jgi:hypothetical protein
MTGRVSILFFVLAFSVMPESAFSQLSGHNTKGDFGLLSGTQSPPGWYMVAPMYYRYSADEFRDRNGDRLLATDRGGRTMPWNSRRQAWTPGPVPA